jgi:Transposase DDE domain
MILDKIFEKFEKKSALTVMARALLERALDPEPLDQLFENNACSQRTEKLLFSTVIDTLTLVVTGFYKSVHAVYVDLEDFFPVELTNVYEKLKRVELPVMQELVRFNAAQLTPVVAQLACALPELLPGYRVKILDGNCLAGTDHRLKVLRGLAAAALPGKSLVVYNPQLDLVIDVFPCEDPHAQERSLLPQVVQTVQAGDLWIDDRNFCTRNWLCAVANRSAFSLVREHGNLPWQAVTDSRYIGRVETGEVFEQQVEIPLDPEDPEQLRVGKVLRVRRIVIKLDQPTGAGDTEVVLISNVPEADADALTLARLYLKRWKIETVFHVITETLDCEQAGLGYPRAALLSFCVTLVAYNILAVVQGALRAVHGTKKIQEEVSLHHVTEKIKRDYGGMMTAIEPENWEIFRTMSLADFAQTLRELAAKVPLEKYRKAKTRKKKPPTKRIYDPAQPHIATAKLLDKRQKR